MSYNDDDDDGHRGWYGTPFAPLERQENAPKKAELDLTVRDEKGRRRFHGAFTGGFSAGHFNTVGTVEGWVPSQYKSTRGEKWSRDLMKSKPEDYMDEEDLGVFGIAPRTVHTTDKFTGDLGGGFAGFRDTSKSIVEVLKDVIKPARESIGVRIFKVMKRGAKFKNAEVIEAPPQGPKVYGCQLPGRPTLEPDPEDYAVIERFELPFKPKVDRKGLGYKGIDPSTIPSGSRKVTDDTGISATVGGRRLKISGEAFGYGALSDEEDLDEDAQVYGTTDLSEYDFAIGGKNDRRSNSHLLKSVLNMEKLEGYVLETSKLNTFIDLTRKYPLPRIPRGWKPRPPWASKSDVKRKSRWDEPAERDRKKSKYNEGYQKSDSSSREQSEKSTQPSQHNANTRAIILGEGVVRVTATKKPVEIKRPPTPPERKQFDFAPMPQPALKPLSGFFACKFTRSDKEATESNSLLPGLIRPSDFKQPDEDKSEQEAKVDDTDKSDIGSVRRVDYQWHPHRLLSKRFNVPPPHPQFPDVVGVVTVGRSEVRNRTSVADTKKQQPDLFSQMFQVPSSSAADNSSSANKEQDNRLVSKSQKTESSPRATSSRKDAHNESDNDDDAENEASKADPERPALDLFRAIFASDEEKSDSDSESEIEQKTNENNGDGEDERSSTSRNVNEAAENGNENERPSLPPDVDKQQQQQRPPIAASIADQMTSVTNAAACASSFTRKTIVTTSHGEQRTSEANKLNANNAMINMDDNDDGDDYFGPALPPAAAVDHATQLAADAAAGTATRNHSDDDGRGEHKRDRSSSKKPKHHKKEKKKKRKKEKRKRRRSSSSSAADDESEPDDKLIDAKLSALVRAARS